MDYKEYAIEDKKPVNLDCLKVEFIPKEDFVKIHRDSILICADILIKYKDGFLLLKIDNVLALGEYWVIGGRIQKGISTEEGVRIKVKEECNLELKNLRLLNFSRTYWKTDPFKHGKGTDAVNFMYLADGVGDIKLDNLHSNPLILTQELFKKMKHSLHPYQKNNVPPRLKRRGLTGTCFLDARKFLKNGIFCTEIC